jgi:hypothetical protein
MSSNSTPAIGQGNIDAILEDIQLIITRGRCEG